MTRLASIRCRGESLESISMTILFLHGWHSVPGVINPSDLAIHGHEVFWSRAYAYASLLNMLRRRIVVAFVGGLLIWGGASWLGRATENRIVVVNRSGQPVSSLTVAVYGSDSCPTFRDLPDGAEASAPFRIRGDGGFSVVGSLADGTRIQGGNFGYVTGGMYGERARFVIRPGGGLDFSQGTD
jgi:hypothetical protein